MVTKLDFQITPTTPIWKRIQASQAPSIASMIDLKKFEEVQAAKAKSNLALGLGIGAAVLVIAGGAYFVSQKPAEFTPNCGYMPNRRVRRRKVKTARSKAFRQGYNRGYRAGRKHCRR